MSQRLPTDGLAIYGPLVPIDERVPKKQPSKRAARCAGCFDSPATYRRRFAAMLGGIGKLMTACVPLVLEARMIVGGEKANSQGPHGLLRGGKWGL